ncbi:low molecular weight protein tyrosine phosphatase family protein [Rhodopirellula sp. SWK7]|uniref:low molecular weight protein tyrosine phosphatase family protein n=1 Tax=Rhodopirellula sp. SWK7 TaxID=595460 RepID=UPI0002BD50C5|nr:phosphotyrosine protein phosphatase [Rhodopirellula sp. SWK7]EMI44986.1 phosphotyrosine protein phosphatase [Rhodopirellula sp. SWK7]
MNRIHLLFVCSRNQWRSPTAEQIYRNDARVSVRSRGTARNAKRTINADDIRWSDLILVMEDKHRRRILADFPDPSRHTPLHVLDIPDEYQPMDPELVELIRSATEPHLDAVHQEQLRREQLRRERP